MPIPEFRDHRRPMCGRWTSSVRHLGGYEGGPDSVRLPPIANRTVSSAGPPSRSSSSAASALVAIPGLPDYKRAYLHRTDRGVAPRQPQRRQRCCPANLAGSPQAPPSSSSRSQGRPAVPRTGSRNAVDGGGYEAVCRADQGPDGSGHAAKGRARSGASAAGHVSPCDDRW
jgi:hypothetical protein